MSNTINKRLFGSPIPDNVKEILKYRQGDTYNEAKIGDSISQNLTQPFRMDDKTPFVRMWTSVKLIEPSSVVDISKEEVENDPNLNVIIQDDGTYVVNPNKKPSWYKQRNTTAKDQLERKFPKKMVTPVKEKGKIIGYRITDEKKQVNYARQIYEVGNHTYQENYGGANPTDSVQINPDLSAEQQQNVREGVSDLFPPELKNNTFSQPQAGITSLSVETEGSLGVIKKTTINFMVNNFNDYDKIYDKYFLTPGATVFIDYGWSDIPFLYRPTDLLDSLDKNEYLYNKETGFIANNQGKVEVLQGVVTDYSSKIKENGTVECSLTLTSSNNALLSLSLDSTTVNRVKDLLTRGILYLGIRQIIKDSPDDIKQLQSTPNKDSSATSIDSYEKNLRLLATQELSGNHAPTENAIKTGIFVDNLTAENVYIAWGLFEDLIINSIFGFGKTKEEIQEGKNFQVSMNSEASFCSYNPMHVAKQRVLLRVPEEPPVFVFPNKWGDEPSPGSYSYQKDKYPNFDYEDKKEKGIWDGSGPLYKFDTNLNGGGTNNGRIPLREVFISVDTIISAFEDASNIKGALEQILEDINEDSAGFFSWKLVTGDIDSQLRVIDRLYTLQDEESKLIVNDENQETTQTSSDDNKPSPPFVFKVMSPTSIVKDYNLEFKLPSGNVGNMYAIQGMSHGNSLFTLDQEVNAALALAATDEKALSIIYEPDLGSLRAEELLDQKNNSEEKTIYDTAEEIFSTETFNTKVTTQVELIEGSNPLTDEGVVEDNEIQEVQDTETESDELVQKNDKNLETKGFKVMTSFRDYYKTKMVVDTLQKNKPVLLPYTLSLTTYGISSINPGDTFQVDYLPQRYLDTTFVQTTKVIHDIGPGGWYTTLDTQFRLMPDKVSNIQNIDREKVRLSPTVLNKQSFEEMIEANDGWFNNSEIGIKDISPFMTHMTLEPDLATNRLDYVVKFQVVPELADELGDAGGEISHYDTTFYAYYALDIIEAYEDIASCDLGIHTSTEWYDWINASSLISKKITNYIKDGADSYLENLLFRATITGQYFYPPSVILEPNRMYYLMVRGDSFGIVDPRYNGKKFIKFFDNFIGDNREGYLF